MCGMRASIKSMIKKLFLALNYYIFILFMIQFEQVQCECGNFYVWMNTDRELREIKLIRREICWGFEKILDVVDLLHRI